MKKIIVLLGAGAVVVGLVVWGFIEGRKEVSLEQERERPVQVPTRIVVQDGGTAVVFDADTQKRADIVVAPMQEVTRRGEIEALATVLPANELIELRNAYVTAKIQADRTQATAHATQQEYERVKTLHGDEQNVSTKVLEATEATWRADEASARGANESLSVVERSAPEVGQYTDRRRRGQYSAIPATFRSAGGIVTGRSSFRYGHNKSSWHDTGCRQ